MPRARLSFDEAMTLWQARDVYRVHALFRGLVLVFFAREFLWWCLDHTKAAVVTWLHARRR
jgi:hypothetical protein